MPARLLILILLLPTGLSAAWAGRHPRLFLSNEDIRRVRHVCGVGEPVADARGWGRFGEKALDFNALRAYFTQRVGDAALPGELPAAAFLHWVSPVEAGDDERLALLNLALKKPDWITLDPLELVLALDWGWDSLELETRQEFLLAVRQRAKALTPADSPLDHPIFREKLACLAVALIVDQEDDNSAAWEELRKKLLSAAQEYFEKTLPAFIALRGLAPTSPAAAAWEENDTALALELAALLDRPNFAGGFKNTSRWLEHYVFATLQHPALQHHFIRDDGTEAPLSPAPSWGDLLPVTAHLLAVRTRDPAATLTADRVEQALRNEAGDPRAALWRWVPIVFDTRGLPRCDSQRLPLARNFRGAVIFRGSLGPLETAVWIEAGQPYLRKRQHFDAGHFLIHGGGQLAVEGRDDVIFEAVPGKGGFQGLGREKKAFDFEQYFAATIAHNCIVLWDSARAPRWYGKIYAPVGGQRLIEGLCTDFTAPPDSHPRRTARQLAYGWNVPLAEISSEPARTAPADAPSRAAAYLALDLSPAYEPDIVSAYTREFVFLADFGLIVIDRIQVAESRTLPTWVLNVPARPTINGQELTAEARVAGSDNDAGVWQADDAEWLHWTDRDGAVWCKSLLPAPRKLRIVGGPARKHIVSEGPLAGHTYVGGDTDGFERLVIPANRYQPKNAWYKLGRPTLLGPQFGQTPQWGRLEIEPGASAKKSSRAPETQPNKTPGEGKKPDDALKRLKGGYAYLFVTVLALDRADATTPPEAVAERLDQSVQVRLALDKDRVVLTLPDGLDWGGTLERAGVGEMTWTFPKDVTPDAPLAVR